MAEFELNDYFKEPEPKGIENDDDERVLLFIAEKGVTYPTEIGRACDLHPETVNRILFSLCRKEYVRKVNPPQSPSIEDNPLFLGITPEMNQKGVITYEHFCRYSWWTLTFEGLIHLYVFHEGEHRPIKKSLMHMIEKEEGIKFED